MSDKLVTIGTFENMMLAAVARNKLDGAGIRSFLNDTETSSLLFGVGINSVKLQVAEEDADRALDVLQVPEEEDVPEGAFTETAPEPDPEDMDPETPEDKEIAAQQAAEVSLARSPRDVLADRAFRATLVGLVLWPVMLYAMALMWQVYISDEPLRPERRLKAIVAGVLCLFSLFVLLMLIRLRYW